MNLRKYSIACLGISLLISSAQALEIKSGRAIPLRSFSFEVNVGFIQNIEGSIIETKRAYSDGQGPESFSRYLENYDLGELGFDDGYFSNGITLEKKWKYITLGLDLNYSQLDASGVAEREPFAIGTDVSYQGQSYDYMLIEQGAAYDIEMNLFLINASLDITPFHLESTERHISFTPWIHLGFLGAVAEYEIDAGPPKGVTTYEFHPYDYVINGQGDGVNGGAIPEIGIGGELRLGIFETRDRMANLVLSAEYFLLDVDTSLGTFGVSARNDKDVSVDYKGYTLGAQLEIPISEKNDFLVGIRFRHVEAEAEIEAQRTPEDEQTARAEKYDKFVTLEFDSLYGTVGMTF